MAVWYHFYGDDSSVESEVRTALSATGLELVPKDAAGPHDPGILCLSEFGEGPVQISRETRRSSQGQLLILAATLAPLPQRAVWQLLDAGASEVLRWRHDGTSVRQVSAKLERWIAVSKLAATAAVQASLVGVSARWCTIVRNIVEAAHFSRSPILLTGESGTGKELLARLVHLIGSSNGDQRTSSLDPVTLDCSTIVHELSGSELFGHERGAFTGAINPRDGAFALADGSTLFLDEIGELPLTLQTQLLRAVQEGTYKRVGSNVWQNTDFRLVCATNRNLSELVEQGKFRLDLYYRIAGWVFVIPPLRERREDILPLARHFLGALCSEEQPLEFDEVTSEYLLNRQYPGNVRDLRQLVQRMVHRHAGPGPISIGDIPEDDRPTDLELKRAWPDERFEQSIADAITLGATLKEIAQATNEITIRIAVQSEKGNLQRAAGRLGITDRALQMRRASGKIPY